MKNTSKPVQGTKLLACDPSLTATGMALFHNDQPKAVYQIRTKKGENRLTQIALRIKELIDREKPTVLAIETQYIAIKSNAVIKVVEVKGLIEGIFLASCLDRNIEGVIVEVSPMQAKQAVGVGGGLKRAESKLAVKKMVTLLYPWLRDESQDILDAVAIGIAGEADYRIKNRF